MLQSDKHFDSFFGEKKTFVNVHNPPVPQNFGEMSVWQVCENKEEN